MVVRDVESVEKYFVIVLNVARSKHRENSCIRRGGGEYRGKFKAIADVEPLWGANISRSNLSDEMKFC